MSSKELIIAACERGDLPQLRRVLEETELDVGSEPLGSEGEIALHVACAHGHLGIVQYLVNDRGCSVAVPNSRAVGGTPLEVAWANKRWEVVEFLLNAIQGKELFAEVGLTPTTVTQLQEVAKCGDEALHQACIHGYLEAVKFLACSLYEKGYYLTAIRSHGTTPLQLAWENKHWEVASYLLQSIKDQVFGLSQTAIAQLLEVVEYREDTFHVACSRGNLEVVHYLRGFLKCSLTQCNSQGETPLDIARSYRQLHVIHFLLESGECSAPDMTELHIVCLRKNEEKVRILASNVATLSTSDRYGVTAVHYATCQPDNLRILVSIAEQKDLFSLLVRQDGRGNTPLHYAASCGQIGSVQLLLSYYKSVNMQNSDGDTPLHLSIKNGYCNSARLVRAIAMHESCNPSTVNAQNETPLQTASQNGDVYVAESLLSTEKCSPEDVEIAIEAKLLLHKAVATGRYRLVKALLKVSGCNINHFNTDGETPLHVACKSDFEVFKLLIADSRCDINAQNRDGLTALHIIIASVVLRKHYFIHSNLMTDEGPTVEIEKDRRQALCILIKHSECNPNMKNNKGDSALHLAVRKHSYLYTTHLLQHEKIDPNIQNHIGNTPLHEVVISRAPIEVMECLLEHRKCYAFIINENEKTPLQLASENGLLQHFIILVASGKYNQEEIEDAATTFKYLLHQTISLNDVNQLELLQLLQCDVNEANQDGETPLHIACRQCSFEVVQMLVADKRCDVNAQNNTGETALHIAVYSELHSVQKVQSILYSERCNPNITNNNGHTPLHVTARKLQFQSSEVLLKHSHCNANIQDLIGNTPLHVALTSNASLWNVEPFLNHQCIDLNIQNREGNTPLHEAVVRQTPVNVVKALALHKSCNPSIVNDAGMTPLQISLDCRKIHYTEVLVTYGKYSHEEIVKVTESTHLLHRAVSSHNNELLTALCNAGVNIDMSNSNGETALHIACREGNIKATQLLLQSKANILVVDNNGNAPIHLTCTHTNCECLELLLGHHACNPNQQNAVGDTPLHILCRYGWDCDMKVLHTLLSTPGINPECVNHAGQIPAELAKSSYSVVQKISKYWEHKNTQLETYLKVFVVGNSGGGKSTLIKALTTEKSRSFRNIFRTKFINPSEVPPHTAGIVPLSFNSKHFGHVVVYDLAGEKEYYSSHAAVMENLVLPSPPLFLLLIDISKSIEEVREELLYWWMFIDNHSKRATTPPHVILVGSHKDIVKERRGNVEKTMKRIMDTLRDIQVSFQFDCSKAFSLDCRKLVSRGLTALLTQLKLTCQTLRQTANTDLHCHILKAFLTTHFHNSTASEISEIVERMKLGDDLLPQEPSQLIPLLSTLSDKGHLLLLQNRTDVKKSWVVLQPEVLLTEVNGSIFAPDNFKENCSGFAMSTGVVTLSKIKETFGKPNNQVIIGYLIHLEFCFRIKDQHTLEMITKDDTMQVTTNGSEHAEEYYFFPALIQKENPSDVYLPKVTIKYECGWFYRCNEPTEQLTTCFLHVLILRLAFSCNPLDESTEKESVVLLRSCSVWKHGIAWWTNDGIETIVEVNLQCHWVAVMLRCPDTHKVQCAQLRTRVISTVLKTKQDFCPAISMKEFLIAPSSLQYPFEGRELTLYSMREIAKAVIAGEDFLTDNEGKATIHIPQLLPFEPFFGFGEHLIDNLFASGQSMEKEISQHDMFQIAKKCYKRLDDFLEALQPNPTAFQRECVKPGFTEVDTFVALIQIVQRRGCKTWRDFEQEFSQFSIFCGRYPMDLALGISDLRHTYEHHMRSAYGASKNKVSEMVERDQVPTERRDGINIEGSVKESVRETGSEDGKVSDPVIEEDIMPQEEEMELLLETHSDTEEFEGGRTCTLNEKTKGFVESFKNMTEDDSGRNEVREFTDANEKQRDVNHDISHDCPVGSDDRLAEKKGKGKLAEERGEPLNVDTMQEMDLQAKGGLQVLQEMNKKEERPEEYPLLDTAATRVSATGGEATEENREDTHKTEKEEGVVSVKNNETTTELGDESTGCMPSQAATGGSKHNLSALCPVCNHLIQVTNGGVFCMHGPLSSRCKGSGTCMSPSLPLSLASPSLFSPEALSLYSSVTPDATSSEIIGHQIFSTINNLQRKTLTSIPHGSRLLAAQALQKSLDKIIASPSDLAPWCHLLCMAYLGLHTPPHCQVHSVREKSLTSKVNINLRRFLDALNGEDPAVVEDVHPSISKRVSKPKDAKKCLAGRIAEKISAGDVSGAVRLASSDNTFIPPNPDTLEILHQMYPPKSSSSLPIHSLSADTQKCAVKGEVLKAIKSFPSGSGGGLDGLRPQHLKDLVGGGKQKHEMSLLKSLTIFVNLVLNGEVPDDIRPIFFGASLCALQTKDGGVQSIAIGNTLRRLVSKIALKWCRDRCSTLLLPNQLGFGVRMGPEAAIHTARSFIRNHQTNSVLLKVDITNAFNSIHRDKVLEAVSKHVPSLSKYVHSSYAVSSFFAFGNHLVYSEEGVQQGDPLSPLLFCLTIHPIIKHLFSPLNMWYLDNGTLGGPLTQVVDDFHFIQSEGMKYGLQVNPEKCQVVALSDNSSTTLFEHVQQVSIADLTLLGAPLGEQAVTAFLEEKTSELAFMGDRLSWMSAHHALFLLKNCFALPKLLYVLRTSPCFNHSSSNPANHADLKSFDALQINLLQRILNIKLDDRAGLQAYLPVRFGGLGIVSATRVASSAYISSKLSCANLEFSLLAFVPPSSVEPSLASELDCAISCWKASSGSDHFPLSMHQRDWSSPVFEKVQKSLISSAVDMQDKARLLAVSEKEAGAWLEALPVPSLGLHLNNDELRIAISLRLGVPTCSEFTCICSEKVGGLGTHGLKCKVSKGRLSRHHLVNDVLAQALAVANVSVKLPPGIVREDSKQPDGMSNVPWSQGRHLVWNFTCPDTLAPSHLPATSVEVGSAAKAAEERQVVKYQSFAADHIFVPIAIETLGPMGPEAKHFLQELGRRLNHHTGESRSASFLRQQISMAIQKGNAVAIMGCMS